MIKKISLIAVCMLLLVSNVLVAQNKYVGAGACKMCHMSGGKAWPVWSTSKHAKAFEVLKGEAALKVGQDNGVTTPSTDAKCLKCHTTASSAGTTLNGGITNADGVSCESCHGAGSKYKTVMTNVQARKDGGLVIPTKEVCIKCHNTEIHKSLTFDFETKMAIVRHKK